MASPKAAGYEAVSQMEEAKVPDRRVEMAHMERSVSTLRIADVYDKAASRISDALEGVMRKQPLESRCSTFAFHVHLCIHVVIKNVLVPALVLVTFFERPFWCAHDMRCECLWDPRDPESCPYPTFDVAYLKPEWTFDAECVILASVVFHQFTLRCSLGGGGYWRDHGWEALAVFAIVAFLTLLRTDEIYQYAGFAALLGDRIFLVVPLFRLAVFVAYSTDVKSQLHLVRRIIPHYLRVGFMIALMMTFFAWFGVVLFPNSAPTDDDDLSRHKLSEGDNYFPNFKESMWSLLILISTANFPDVAMPAYNLSRWSMVFFVVYLILGMFFFMNLLLATVYNVYTDEQKKQDKQMELNRDENLKVAFELLAGDKGYVDTEAIRGVFAELNMHQEVMYINDDRSAALLSALDCSTESQIFRAEFDKLCGLIQLKDPAQRDALDHFSEDDDSLRAGIARLVLSPQFEYLVDVLILFNAVVVAMQTKDELFGVITATSSSKSSETSSGAYWETAEMVLALFYFLEMTLKMCALGGVGKYLRFRKNQFDALVTMSSVLTVAVVYYPNAYNDPVLIRYVLVVRLVRVVRLLEAFEEFNIIIESFLNMIPAAMRLLKLLFVTMYLFALVGMYLYAGKINADPARSEFAKLQQTDFYDSLYMPLNFNDMWSAYVVLFSILVINNWQVITSGFVAVAGDEARLYFIAFYAIGTLICVNLAVAFILDSFADEQDRVRTQHSEASIRRTKASRRRASTLIK